MLKVEAACFKKSILPCTSRHVEIYVPFYVPFCSISTMQRHPYNVPPGSVPINVRWKINRRDMQPRVIILAQFCLYITQPIAHCPLGQMGDEYPSGSTVQPLSVRCWVYNKSICKRCLFVRWFRYQQFHDCLWTVTSTWHDTLVLTSNNHNFLLRSSSRYSRLRR